MTERILDDLVIKLRSRRGSLPEVSKASGIPLSTLRKISQRVNTNPTLRHVQALVDYFDSAASSRAQENVAKATGAERKAA